ncbi:MAG: 30S ribosomal protein S12 methylthiotransferase RimO [Alphaproteobacteria bacterium]|jgi:ribosomal protein S12 methylthiotransferase|nr:30S ribosomal protein S12 methylthiotransferase RimO [Alphaproteobacteria bacterium]MBP9867549.1 30S ribosomal protein S12 methylthiotransferase RimO [Alphaproteobacteria bacterium]
MPEKKLTVPKIGVVSLGCPKALVDSERIMTQLRSEGYHFSDTHQDADVVIVNTCGFLDSAKEESLAAIGQAMKDNGRVIVTGCMGAEPEQIEKVFPNILAVTGPHQYEQVVDAVHAAVPPVHDPFMDLVPDQGLRLTPRHYAYLKISEGCNNRCSFCIIPKLRGDLVSRPIHHVMFEAEKLVNAGVKELLVISQDTSAYGIDTKYAEYPWKGQRRKTKFLDLCEALGELGVWVRLHYVYPYPHVDEVIELMAQRKILPYLDIPFQHASHSVLKAMKRPAAQEKTLERIKKWREVCPDLTIRSSFIVGFPGETEDDFESLLEWMTEAKIDRAGCFKYENVAGAVSNDLPNHVPEEVKQERWERFMEIQRQVSDERLQAKIGQTLSVIIDEVDDEGGADARSMGDAPEIDGKVLLRDAQGFSQGDIVEVEVEDADDYDLYAVPVTHNLG